MDLTIVAFYTLCDNFLIQDGYQDDPRAKKAAAEVMTTVLVTAQSEYLIANNTILADYIVVITQPLSG